MISFFTLTEMRELTNRLYYGGQEYRDNPGLRIKHGARLAELFRELDRELSCGGELPQEWKKSK